MEYLIIKQNKTAIRLEAENIQDLSVKLTAKGLKWTQDPEGIDEVRESSSITDQIGYKNAEKEFIVSYSSVNFKSAGLIHIAADDKDDAMDVFNMHFRGLLDTSSSSYIIPGELIEIVKS